MSRFVVIPIEEGLLPRHFMEAFNGKPVEGEYDLTYDAANVTLDGVPTCGYVTVQGDTFFLSLGNTPLHKGCVVRRIDRELIDPVLSAYGGVLSSINTTRCKDEDLQKWLMDKLSDLVEYRKEGSRWHDRIKAMQPMRSQIADGKISIYQNIKDLSIDRNVAMKAGRAFKAMYPELPPNVIEVLVDEFRSKFTKRNFTLVVSSEPDDFAKAYSHDQAEMQNPSTTQTRKSLANSCMRYEFDNLPMHPCANYGSGDFNIIYLKDSKGCIAARCVVYTKHTSGIPQAGPIYGVCEHSLDMIDEYLISINAVKNSRDATWLGAKLIRVEHEGGFVAPYLDLSPQQLTDNGEYLVVCQRGEINATDYGGLLNANDCQCAECGEGLSEDENCYSEYNDNSYCECCYNELHFYCQYIQESYHNDQAVEVWAVTGNGRFNRETVSDDARDSFFVLCTDGEYWNTDDAIHCEFNDEHASPREMEDGDYFISDWDGEVYPMSQFCLLDNDESVSKQELDEDSGIWELNDNKNTWTNVQEEMKLCTA